jgi:hypothetical protein
MGRGGELPRAVLEYRLSSGGGVGYVSFQDLLQDPIEFADYGIDDIGLGYGQDIKGIGLYFGVGALVERHVQEVRRELIGS